MKRSFGVSFFSIWVLLLGIANLIRSLSFFRQSRFLADIGISLNPVVAAVEACRNPHSVVLLWRFGKTSSFCEVRFREKPNAFTDNLFRYRRCFLNLVP
jgi:hypothetical protein